MLVTFQPILKRFWYAVCRAEDLREGPKPFTLLEHEIVLWLDADGHPAAMADRCCHRFARLSRGKVVADGLQCAYHGFTYDARGRCIRIPQLPEGPIPEGCRVPSFRCKERYGFIWVCVGEPLADIPDVPEFDHPGHRVIPLPIHTWPCSALAAIENIFDNSHHHFVHRQFGDREDPVPLLPASLEETEQGLRFEWHMRDYTTPLQRVAWGIEDEQFLLVRDFNWYTPFSCKLILRLPRGVNNITVIFFTPLTDTSTQCNAFVVRNDTEADTKAEDVRAMSLHIIEEDLSVLAAIATGDVPLDPAEQQHVPSDQTGLIMRRRFSALLRTHGEQERRGPRLDA